MSIPSRTLYDIDDDLTAIENLLLELGGDVTDLGVEVLMDRYLADIGSELDAKLDAYAALIQELTARAKARKDEADRLAARSRIDSNAADRLKARLLVFFQMHNMTTHETARFRLSVAKNGGLAPLIVTAPENVPEEFCKVRVEPVNKTIGEALVAVRRRAKR